jgi:hypothetical protein
MKIAFFGDSFCARLESHAEYDTYIKKIQNHYSANIVNLGIGGSSVYDVILKQIPDFLKNNIHPDICIFVWTAPTRLYHPQVRHINYSQVSEGHHTTNMEIWKAAEQFYNHLYDHELMTFQYRAALHYFDRTVLTKFPNTTKIIHMWSYDDEYYYRWENGVEIKPALNTVTKMGETKDVSRTMYDSSPNHLAGEVKNSLVFSWLRDTIDLPVV